MTKWKWFPPFVFIKIEIKAEGTWANNYVDTDAVTKAVRDGLGRPRISHGNNVVYLDEN